MTLPLEVGRLQQRLDDTFRRTRAITDAELLSDSAKYLCVLVSGYLEQAIIEILLQHVRRSANATIQRHLERDLRRQANFKTGKILSLFGSFSPAWEEDLATFIVDEKKAAIDSIVSLRHTIAHGRHSGITITRVREYYAHVGIVVEHLAAISL